MWRASHVARVAKPCLATKGFGPTTKNRPENAKKPSRQRLRKEEYEEERLTGIADIMGAHRLAVLDSLHHHLSTDVTLASSQQPTGDENEFHMRNQQMLRSILTASPVARGMLDIELRENRHADETEAFDSPASSAIVDVSVADVVEAGPEGTPRLPEADEPIPDDAVPASAQAGASGDADLAARIARLWDTVPDELRELMAQSGAADAEAAGAGYGDAAAGTRVPEPGAPASSSRPTIDMGASMSAAADIDALLAPLRADYPLQAERAARVPVDAHDNNSRERPALAEEPGETPALAVSTDAATDSVTGGSNVDEDGRILLLQQELANVNSKVKQLKQSEQQLRQELDRLKRSAASSSVRGSGTTSEQQQALASLEVQVASIANRLLEASLTMGTISTAERRHLRAIVNDLLALDFTAAAGGDP